MTVQASDMSTERVSSKGFAGTSWNGTRSSKLVKHSGDGAAVSGSNFFVLAAFIF
jgi:hypothetical protein